MDVRKPSPHAADGRNGAAERVDSELLAAARSGEERAFGLLVAPHVPAMRAALLRLLCNPADADDAVQEAMLSAFENLASFREDAAIRTWLISIAVRKGLDVLRRRRRWPIEAQQIGEQHFLGSDHWAAELAHAVQSTDVQYEQRQHVAYCFSCVLRSLPPDDAAAVLLVDLFLLEHREAARALGTSTSRLRHARQAGLTRMSADFEQLCALVNKAGVCYQCSALREYLPERSRGAPVAPLAPDDAAPAAKLKARLHVVREASADEGPSATIHRTLMRFMASLWDGPEAPVPARPRDDVAP